MADNASENTANSSSDSGAFAGVSLTTHGEQCSRSQYYNRFFHSLYVYSIVTRPPCSTIQN